MTDRSDTPAWPRLDHLGIDGILVRFGDRLDESANRAALAFRAAADDANLDGLEETSTSLASAYLRFDPDRFAPDAIRARLTAMLGERDWFAADLPGNRRLWHIPTAYGGDLGPQLREAAIVAGLTEEEAIASIANTRVRVQTIGFAPGQPYLGELPPDWDIPRQTQLTERVPAGALTVAIRQLVLFSVSAPTGWRHIGQTAFQLFRPESDTSFVLNPGDEAIFKPISAEEFHSLADQGPDGGATFETIL